MKRCRDAIIQQILNICMDGAKKTQIVYQANLNFRTVDPYLKLLTEKGFIDTKQEPSLVYKTTEKGESLLESIDRVVGYTLVTRRGHEVNLEGGKEGISKKLDELLSP